MVGRTLQSMTQQKQQLGPGVPAKELMPVPSPQLAYQYNSNTFDNPEMIIQKTPNTSLKESNLPG